MQFSGESNDAGVAATDGSNFPYASTPVTVIDSPGTCRQTPGGTLDHWIVTNALDAGATAPVPFLGALMKDVTNGAPLQSGQYVMPFKLLIEARTCVPF